MIKGLKLLGYFLILMTGIFGLKFLSEYDFQTRKLNQEWQLVWQDEFDYIGAPDPNKWIYDLGTGCPIICGWGNNELQYYTNSAENVKVENGQLTITALNDTIENSYYSSARIKTLNKFDFTYGKVEVRANNPVGKGSWPAIWMLPTEKKYGGWPKSGEIDIMEHVGFDQDSIFGTVHTEAYNHMRHTHKSGSIYTPDNEKEFHVYGIEWDENKIDFLVDQNVYFTFENENKTSAEWPYDQNFHLILNLAVGGNWGGQKGVDKSSLPWNFEIDYVRIYQKEDVKKVF